MAEARPFRLVSNLAHEDSPHTVTMWVRNAPPVEEKNECELCKEVTWMFHSPALNSVEVAVMHEMGTDPRCENCAGTGINGYMEEGVPSPSE